MMPSPKIASFIYSCPRTPPTLPAALESIRAAGFDPVVLVDSGAVLGAYGGPGTTVMQPADKRRGPWEMLKFSLSIGVQLADWVVCWQDDVTAAKGTADWLLAQIELEPQLKSCGCLSLYAAEALTNGVSKTGWHEVKPDDLPRRAYGALALAFPAESARLLLAKPPTYRPSVQSVARGLHADLNCGLFCKQSGRPWLFHLPSLVQHTGVVSVAHQGAALSSFRRASEVVSDVAEIANWVPSKNTR